MGVLEGSVRETTGLHSSRYIVGKLDAWSQAEKKNYLQAYQDSEWEKVYSLTGDLNCCAYMRSQILGELADVIAEQQEG